MIADDFIIYSDKGLYCKAGGFYLDPVKPVHHAIITHAHADHAMRGSNTVYCTAPTALFMKERYNSLAGKNFILCSSKEKFRIGNINVSFLPAGHMLGSVQVLLEHENIRYLYTGDFKLQADSTCEPFEFSKADVLITETTFAEPHHIHPHTEAEIAKLNNLNDAGIVIGAYSLGKAQRLTSLISKICPHKEIFIHRNIYPFHKIYENHDIALGSWKPYSGRLFKQLKQSVCIVPPHVFSHFSGRKSFYFLFASGWNHRQNGCSIQFNISDHADWNDLLTVIEKTQPKKILTLHGNGQSLKNYLSGQQYEVEILN